MHGRALAALAIAIFVSGCVYLKVITHPPGAQVRVDGDLVGTSPVETSINAFALATPTDIAVDLPGYFPNADRIGWWESWFWIWGTTKTRHIELWRTLPCPQCGEGTTIDMKTCPKCGLAFE